MGRFLQARTGSVAPRFLPLATGDSHVTPPSCKEPGKCSLSGAQEEDEAGWVWHTALCLLSSSALFPA